MELDLSENAMREVPSETWRHAKALMRLNLSGNPIKLIRWVVFEHKNREIRNLLSHKDFVLKWGDAKISKFDEIRTKLEKLPKLLLKLEQNLIKI